MAAATLRQSGAAEAAGLPLVTVLHGSSTAGGAYLPGLADYVVMVVGRSKVFLAGPPLLKAATGESPPTKLGGADLHCVVDGPWRISRRGRRAMRCSLAREIIAKLDWGAPRGAGQVAGAAIRSRGVAGRRAHR